MAFATLTMQAISIPSTEELGTKGGGETAQIGAYRDSNWYI